jgi:hypothetical protein
MDGYTHISCSSVSVEFRMRHCCSVPAATVTKYLLQTRVSMLATLTAVVLFHPEIPVAPHTAVTLTADTGLIALVFKK